MQAVLGVLVVCLSLLCWGGQVVSWFAPATAVKLTLMEDQNEVEPTFWSDIRGEALWDVLTTWTMVVAGVLLIVDSDAWPYFALVGGGMYVYFAGRGVFTRVAMLQSGLRIGSRQSVWLGMVLLTAWGLLGLITIVAAVASLEG